MPMLQLENGGYISIEDRNPTTPNLGGVMYDDDPWRMYAVEVCGFDPDQFDRLVRCFKALANNA